jgi:hypothetical protein
VEAYFSPESLSLTCPLHSGESPDSYSSKERINLEPFERSIELSMVLMMIFPCLCFDEMDEPPFHALALLVLWLKGHYAD